MKLPKKITFKIKKRGGNDLFFNEGYLCDRNVCFRADYATTDNQTLNSLIAAGTPFKWCAIHGLQLDVIIPKLSQIMPTDKGGLIDELVYTDLSIKKKDLEVFYNPDNNYFCYIATMYFEMLENQSYFKPILRQIGGALNRVIVLDNDEIVGVVMPCQLRDNPLNRFKIRSIDCEMIQI